MEKKTIRVVAAVVEHDGKFLITQRRESGSLPLLWEFPGGRVEADEDDKDARRDAWRAEGIKLCIEQIQEVREIEGVAGVHIMAIEWEAAIKPIVEGAGLFPRPDVLSE